MKSIRLLLLCAAGLAYGGNNDIYITQSGAGLTLTIDQLGATNKVGTSQARVTLVGTSMVVDIDQVGHQNTLAQTVAQGNSTSWTMRQTGDSNTSTITAGGTGDVASTDFDYAATGDTNVLTLTQGAAATATGGNQDYVIAGNENNVNTTCEVVGCINNWNIDGDTNDVDTTQTGNSDHSITAIITGNTNNIDIDQTNSGGSVSDVVVITATTTGGVIDIDQCTSGC